MAARTAKAAQKSTVRTATASRASASTNPQPLPRKPPSGRRPLEEHGHGVPGEEGHHEIHVKATRRPSKATSESGEGRGLQGASQDLGARQEGDSATKGDKGDKGDTGNEGDGRQNDGCQDDGGPKKAAAKTPAARTATKATAQTTASPAKKATVKKTTADMTAAAKTAKAPAKSTAKTATKTTAKTAAKTTVKTAKAPAKKAAALSAGASRPRPAHTLRVRDDESPWTAQELSAVRAEIEADVAHLRQEIKVAEADLVGLMRDAGDGAGDDQADAGSKTFEREQEISVANNAREMLQQNLHAIERLDDGSYGICESCGNPIGKLRLQAAPRATLCMPCKTKQERR